MSDYQEYLLEREKIDHWLDKGYMITDVTENLSGAELTLKKPENDLEKLLIKTADGRKYFSNLLFQKKEELESR
ncbi:hypothetical protein LCL89_14540 [Halobacillus yeomjeoni]|uniref:Uncharacterized protein n=1 Tax=Halobacillus yeomjeoni TaxID=311194 RepID=A0A931MVR2_9BACI|nr:hypothetical protein [Halobacillus yeomjeoni]MBH0230669.1 hypothetical protein [Halobacillus yeomjeoni]MCA0985248.1 hypothetical protein [Halobacillus yeomjeoni]